MRAALIGVALASALISPRAQALRSPSAAAVRTLREQAGYEAVLQQRMETVLPALMRK